VLDRFEGDMPKLSKVNSLGIGKHIFYMKKIGGSYVAWDYKSKIKIVATDNKPRLIQWLQDNYKEIVERLNGK
jgi:hypothetical protein